jgi:hypothetical protein
MGEHDRRPDGRGSLTIKIAVRLPAVFWSAVGGGAISGIAWWLYSH